MTIGVWVSIIYALSDQCIFTFKTCATMSSQFVAILKKHRTRVVCSTLFRHRQTPSLSKTNFEPYPMLQYAEALCQYIGRSKRHQYLSP